MSARRLQLISVPFHLGVRDVSMGRGPGELLGEGALAERLRESGHDIELGELGDPAEESEVGRIFELNRELSARVRAAREGGREPVVLAGNCNVCIGALGGCGVERCGIVWIDAHPDFQTPETTETGFIDGMGLAIATGACWVPLAGSVPGFQPVDERDVVLVAARDIDEGEAERLAASEVGVIPGGRGPGATYAADVERAVTALAERVDGVYLHVDLDSLDPSLGRANEYACDGGLGHEDLAAVVAAVAANVPVLATSFTAFDPGVDPDGPFRATALEAIDSVVGVTSR